MIVAAQSSQLHLYFHCFVVSCVCCSELHPFYFDHYSTLDGSFQEPLNEILARLSDARRSCELILGLARFDRVDFG